MVHKNGNTVRVSRLMKALSPLVVCWVLLFAGFSLYLNNPGHHSHPRIPRVATGETGPIQNEAHQAAPSSITQPSRPAFSRNTSRESPPPLAPKFREAIRASGTKTPAVARPATLRLSGEALRLSGEVCPPEAHFRETGVGSSSRVDSRVAVGWTLAREAEHEKVLLQARERRVAKLR